MKWVVVLSISLSLRFLLVSCKTHTFSWTPEYFKRYDGQSNIIFGRPGDKLVFKCPEKRTKEIGPVLEIWPVNYHGYQSCAMSCAAYRRVMACNTADKRTHALFLGDSAEFTRGSVHYFIATHQPTKLMKKDASHGNPCRTHVMKLAVHVCDLPMDIACDACSLPLGLEDGRIGPDEIRSSVKHLDKRHRPIYARLQSTDKCTSPQNSWCIEPSRDQYIQVNLRYIHLLSAVATQGSAHSPRWVTQYHLTYSYNGKDWFPYKLKDKTKIFPGNTDQNTIVRQYFKPQFHAKYVRIHPRAWSEGICLRVELYGCVVARKVDKKYTATALIAPLKVGLSEKQDAHALCGSQRCPPYAKCQVSGGKVNCSCAMDCTEGKQVCGDDGITYGSLCKLRQAACEGNQLIKVAKSAHACGNRDSTSVDAKSSSLGFQLRLVAGLLIAVGSLGLITFFAIVWSWRGNRDHKKARIPSDECQRLEEELQDSD